MAFNTAKTIEERAVIQQKVDEYIAYHKEMKKLEKQLRELRSEIEPFMEERRYDIMYGTNGGALELSTVERPVMNARYTSYDPAVLRLLDPDIARTCVTQVVDKEILEAMVKAGKAPKDVAEYKIVTPTRTLRVKK